MKGNRVHIMVRLSIVAQALFFWAWGVISFFRWVVKMILVVLFLLVPVNLDRVVPGYGSIGTHIESPMYAEHFAKMKYHGWNTIVLCENGQEFFWRNGLKCRFW